MTTLEQLKIWVAHGESENLEFKRSTGELKEAMETLCGFLNGSGGRVLIGVHPKGSIQGQQVSEQTLHDITSRFLAFEPPASVGIERIGVGNEREVLILSTDDCRETAPYTYGGRPYERVANTTRVMPQARYEELLLERTHPRRRWENMPAVGVRLEDLDREEILRTRELAVQQSRISAETGTDAGDILDRLGLRRGGELTQAAQVLYGRTFQADYPQCILKMGRFRGTTVTGEIVDNRQEWLNAFAMIREGMAFLERTLPLSARFPKGKIFREDRFPIPPDALREILLNAVMHRDYSIVGGSVAIAIFDDRVEIRSFGRLLTGLTPAMLSKTHPSRLRNPLMAGVFHRTGAVETWGRGTNRVIDVCRHYGAPPPKFIEENGVFVVTFKTPLSSDRRTFNDRRQHSDFLGTGQVPDKHRTSTGQASADMKILVYCHAPRSIRHIMAHMKYKHRETFLKNHLHPLLGKKLLSMTYPDSPKHPKQTYRATPAGEAFLRRLTGRRA
jgi:ATP-dependent DNA helicase RecG